jgi:hypothetical protein
MKRRWPLVIAVVVVGLLALGWFALVEPIRVHGEWDARVRADIRQLACNRPPDVPKGQWEFMVGWTWQMHCNCGMIHTSVEPGWREEFATELERRLAGPMSVADIDWIWDEYAAHTKGGRSYDRYRPTRSEDLKDAVEGCYGRDDGR